MLFHKQSVVPETGSASAAQPDVKAAIENLKQDLEDAGIKGLHMPSDLEIQKEFLWASHVLDSIDWQSHPST